MSEKLVWRRSLRVSVSVNHVHTVAIPVSKRAYYTIYPRTAPNSAVLPRSGIEAGKHGQSMQQNVTSVLLQFFLPSLLGKKMGRRLLESSSALPYAISSDLVEAKILRHETSLHLTDLGRSCLSPSPNPLRWDFQVLSTCPSLRLSYTSLLMYWRLTSLPYCSDWKMLSHVLNLIIPNKSDIYCFNQAK